MTRRLSRCTRWCIALVLALVVALPAISQATSGQKGSAKGGGQKTVHVKEYTKKDGTEVEAHDRKAPKSKGEDRHSLADVAHATAAQRAESQQPDRVKAQEHSTAGTSAASLTDLSRRGAARGTTAQPAQVLTNRTPRASTGQIYTFSDPVTGRKTFTNVTPSGAPTAAHAGSSTLVVPPAASRTAPKSPGASANSSAHAASPSGVKRRADNATVAKPARDAKGKIQRSDAARPRRDLRHHT